MESYDNDFLFYLDDDLFCVWPEDLCSVEEMKKYNSIRAKAKEEEKEYAV